MHQYRISSQEEDCEMWQIYRLSHGGLLSECDGIKSTQFDREFIDDQRAEMVTESFFKSKLCFQQVSPFYN